MPMKFKIAKLEEVPEAVRSLYRQEGDVFVLDVDGVVPKERLDEFRTNNIELSKQLEKLKDIDPAKYRELIELDRRVKEKQLIEAGKVEEVVTMRVEQMRTDFETEKADLTGKLAKANKTLETLMIDNVARDKAIKAGVMPTAVDDVVLRAKLVYTYENGAAVPKDSEGKVIYGKDGKTAMTMEEWVVGLRKTAPHLFHGSSGTGAGGGGGRPGLDTSKLTPAQKISLGLAAATQGPTGP